VEVPKNKETKDIIEEKLGCTE